MCIVLLNKSHETYPLIVLSNRDEFFTRKTSSLARWTYGDKEVYSGRDEERGGTWLVLSKEGRFSALTNFRTPGEVNVVSPASRGELPLSSISGMRTGYTGYGGFSLISGDLQGGEMEVVSNATIPISRTKVLAKETSSCEVTNCDISTEWPKSRIGREKLQEVIDRGLQGEELVTALFEVLKTNNYDMSSLTTMSQDELLYELRNSVFIPRLPVLGGYGTRQQTIIMVSRSGRVQMIERTIHLDDTETEAREEFVIQSVGA